MAIGKLKAQKTVFKTPKTTFARNDPNPTSISEIPRSAAIRLAQAVTDRCGIELRTISKPSNPFTLAMIVKEKYECIPEWLAKRSSAEKREIVSGLAPLLAGRVGAGKLSPIWPAAIITSLDDSKIDTFTSTFVSDERGERREVTVTYTRKQLLEMAKDALTKAYTGSCGMCKGHARAALTMEVKGKGMTVAEILGIKL